MGANFLKKFSFMLMMVVFVFALAACGSKDVEITLPASFFEGEDIDEMITEAKEEEGVKEVTKNDDGSITYKLTKERHKEMMDEMKKEIDTSIEEMKSGDDFASIKDIKHNDKYSEFTVVVKKEDFENSFDTFASFALGLSGMMYQFLDGVDEDKNKVKINYKDESTGDVFDSTVYPDDFEEENE